MTDRYSTVASGVGIARYGVLTMILLTLGLPAAPIRAATAAPGSKPGFTAQSASKGNAALSSPSTPDVVGQWGALLNWPLVDVHAALLHTGQVVMWDAWEFGSTPSAQLWDPTTQTFTGVPNPYSAMFCGGQVTLADGRELVAGGHNGGGIGIVNTSLFDPQAGSWTRVANMNLARWYPTVTTLSDGRVLVLGGDIQNGAPATAPEVYDPAANTWTALSGAQLDVGEYPQSYVMPNGRIFITAGADHQSRILDVGSQTWTNLGFSPPSFGTSAMYLPGKVIEASGGSPPNDSDPVTTTTSVIDLNQSSPTWRQTAPMAYARSQDNLVVLPDGKVLAIGGATEVSLISTSGVFPAELWNPSTEAWTTMASLQDPRMYHSIALLLPDGRVLAAGGGRNSTAVDYSTAQVYSPPYLFQGARPTITSAPSATTYAGTMVVQTPDAGTIGTVSFIRLASVTHTNNMDQRYIPLSFTAGAGSLTVQSPANANTAPPGYYMLFIVNTAGVPSVAQMVQIGATPPLATATSSASPTSTAANTANPTPTATTTPSRTPTQTATGTPTANTALTVTLTAQVSASTDDANQDGTSLDLTSATVWLGDGSSTTSSYTGLRFTNLAIPPGATINSARLQVYSSQTQWLSVNLSLAADATGNSPTFSASSPPSQRALTTQKVAHSSNTQWLANTWYTLDEMAPVVQELVNRADWQSGNSLSLILQGTGTAWGRKFVTGFDGSAATAAKLVITYTAGGGSTSTPTPTRTATPTPTPAPSSTSTNSPIPTPTPTRTPSPTSTQTQTPVSTATPSPTATTTPSRTPTQTATGTPTANTALTVTLTAQVSASTDDANQDGTSLDLTSATVWLGDGSSTTSSYTGLRFTNLAIPPGATINSARLQVYSSQTQWLSVNLSLAADATGNSPTFSASSPPSQRALTTQKVAHSSNTQWLANTWYTLDEMAPVVQELVNRADWQSGNSLSLILQGTGTAWGRKFVTGFDGSAATAAKLVITYTTGGGSTSTPTPTRTATPTAT